MHALTYVVPVLLIGFFLWKGRRDPVYILGMPLLLGYGRSIFLNSVSWQWALGAGITVNGADVSLAVLLVLFTYVRAIRPIAPPVRLTLQLYLCAGLLVLLVAKAFAAGFPSVADVASPGSLLSVLRAVVAARAWFYLPLSIMLWHVVLKRFSSLEILRLLRILTWLTTACAVVYLADLAGLRTYSSIWDPYYTSPVLGGVTIWRDYLSFPAMLFVVLGYSLAHLVYGRERATYFLVAAVLTACALFSFTRAYALSAVGLWVAAVFWRALIVPLRARSRGRRNAMRPARRFLLIGAFAAVSTVVVFAWSTLGVWWAYLGQRLGTLGAGVAGDRSSQVRLTLLSLAAGTISHEGFFLGTLMTSIGATGGVYFLDSYWADVLVSFGWLGLLVMGGLVLTTLVEAIGGALRAQAGSGLLSLALLLGLLAAVVLSLTGGGWVSGAGAFLLAAVGVRFRYAPCAHSTSSPTGPACLPPGSGGGDRVVGTARAVGVS
jgi:hypothetical protein